MIFFDCPSGRANFDFFSEKLYLDLLVSYTVQYTVPYTVQSGFRSGPAFGPVGSGPVSVPVQSGPVQLRFRSGPVRRFGSRSIPVSISQVGSLLPCHNMIYLCMMNLCPGLLESRMRLWYGVGNRVP